jgi:hypothetical protein
MGPAGAVALGGVVGVLGGVAFFRSVRRFAARSTASDRGPLPVVFGIAWRLGAVAAAAGMVAYAGGRSGALAVLGGLVVARIIVRRGSGRA